MFLDARIVVIPVADLGEGEKWYAQVLGFEPVSRSNTSVRFACGGFDLELIAGPLSKRGRIHPTVYWRVETLAKTLDRMLALGACEGGKSSIKDGVGISALVVDPFGNSVGLVQEVFSES